ncbi:MAG: M28 family peptidase [Planctomycetota bacterium]|nr:MAG: M28 family peptidase [Planctomycetota bacterium]
MERKLFLLHLGFCLGAIGGCVSIPAERLSRAIEVRELSEHVGFLAQPALKGRKPMRWESATVRRYIVTRFDAYGLVPWRDAKGYEQAFGLGTNVIGVLPGSDPNLLDEVVIVSAHYDHLGRCKNGVCHGACDNASGVSVLLEIAERLSLAKRKPRRSVCFAAFDCEERMLLGSFAFRCRSDFERAKIAAVVNIDLLGRDGFDVLSDSLFVVGTEGYADLRRGIFDAGSRAQIKLLPVGTDIVGPCGDHVAFESMDVPCIFFSCGPYGDYHKTTDIADKLNYERMTRSATLIMAALEVLANVDKIETSSSPEHVYVEELEAIKFLAEQIIANPEKAKLVVEDANQVLGLVHEADRLVGDGDYSSQDRYKYGLKTVEVLSPLLAGPAGFDKKSDDDAARYVTGLLALAYYNHREVFLEGIRSSASHVITHRRGLFRRMPAFKYRAYCLANGEISVTREEEGAYRLVVLPSRFEIRIEPRRWPLSGGTLNASVFWRVINCKGAKDDIIDYCLLEWVRDLTDESYGKVWRKILLEVAGADYGNDYEEWLEWRLSQGPWEDESEWVLRLMRSGHPKLIGPAGIRAQEVGGSRGEAIIREIILDETVAVGIRAAAIRLVTRRSGREVMLAVTEALDDVVVIPEEVPEHFLEKSHPLYGHPYLGFQADIMDKHRTTESVLRTLGDAAEEQLKMLTGKAYRKNKRAWQRWIEGNVR